MEIKKVCVLGAGIMGAGIAQVVAEAGIEVSMRDIEDRFVEKGMATIKGNLDRAVSKGKMDAAVAAAVMGRVRGTVDLKDAVAGADVVIEAVIEIMKLKREIMA